MTSTRSTLPEYTIESDLPAGMAAPAGNDETQLALHAEALARLESWHNGFHDRYRIRRSVLAANGWKLVMMPLQLADDDDEDRIGAALSAGASHLLAFALGVGLPPGRILRSHGADTDTLFRLMSAMMYWTGLIAPEDWSFMLMGEGIDHYAVLAGPEPMLRAAFPDPARPWADFEADRAAQERICGRPWLRDLIAHYEPYALRA